MRRFTQAERRNRLATRHALAAPAATVDEIASRLVGLHSSDPATVYLSCRARLENFEQANLEKSLYDDRTLLRLHGMRRTMFVVPHDLAAVMDAGCTRLLAGGERRRLVRYLEGQDVVDEPEAWLQRVESATLAALERLGPSSAKELTAIVPELTTRLTFGEGKKWGGTVGVSTRVLFLLAAAGKIIRGRPLGSWLSAQYRWALFPSWIPQGLAAMPTEKAQVELVRRWLGAYGPGSLVDISWWTGWGKPATRRAIDGCGAVEVDMDGAPGYALPDDLERTDEPAKWAALLPSLDSTIMGWKDRAWYLGEHSEPLYDRNGNAGPSVWLDGRVVGGWSQVDNGDIRYKLLTDVGRDARAMIDASAGSLEKWLGDSRLTPRFRTPLEKDLLG